MHTDKMESVSSKAVGLSVLQSAARKTGMAAGFFPQGEDSADEPSVSADCRRKQHFAGRFLPAAGNRWNDELNNLGSWGNYWSSTLNESNPNNAYNLNFNSDNANWNNNNRNNGHTVRPVR